MRITWTESLNGIIGDGVFVPWSDPNDVARLRELTHGQTVIIGRKTYDTAGPLKGRKVIVLSRSAQPTDYPGVEIVNNPVQLYHPAYTNAWVVGGKQVYDLFMPNATLIYQTVVNIYAIGNVQAPIIPKGFRLLSQTWSATGSLYNIFGRVTS